MSDPQNEHAELLIGDDELLSAVRAGETGAFATLYERHDAAARGLARQLVRGDSEVDDVVAEAFTRVLSVVMRGGGPRDGFRPYLLTALRHVAYDRARGEKRHVVTDDMERFDAGEPFVDPVLAGLERSLIAQAFLSLPERWQAVLWHTEIEGVRPSEVAPMFGMSANGVAALAYRAREGLREAYLKMHISGGAPEGCRPALRLLGSFVRGGLAKRDTAVVDTHLDQCSDCREVYAELMDVNVGLRGIVLPLVAGPAAAAYLAALPSGALAGGWWGRMSKSQQQGAAAATAATVVAAAVALALVSEEEALRPPLGDPPPAAAPPQDPAPPGAAPAPPGGQDPADPPFVPAPDEPVVIPPPQDPDDPDAPPAPVIPGLPAFAARIDPVGALVPGRPGIVVLTVENRGDSAPDDVVADITLPRGVHLDQAGRAGNAAPAEPGGGGWSCSATGEGGECVRAGLDAGANVTEYLEVTVASGAAAGDPPSVRVTSGDTAASASGTRGVDPDGTPARYATAGPVRVETAGNALLTCVEPDDHDHHPRWPWWPPHGDRGAAPSVPGAAAAAAVSPTGAAGVPGVSSAADDQRAPSAAGADLPDGPFPVPSPGTEPETPPLPSTPPVPPVPEEPSAPADPTPEPSEPPEPEPSEDAEAPEPPPDDTGGGCAEAQQREGDRRDNDLWDMQPIDLDDDPATAMSSSAVWNLPEGGEVRWAGLYFSGAGDPGAASALLRGPGAAGYTEVAADEVDTVHLPGYSAYQAFADVTELVREHGGGQWWAADIPAETGVGTYAGWSLVTVVEDPGATYSQAMVLDTAETVFQDPQGLRLPLAGLLPASVPATVDAVAWEGDADLSGDRVELNGDPLTPEDGDRDPDNAFTGSARGAVGPPMAFGTDVVRFSAVLPRDPELRLTSRGDAYLAGVVAVTAPMRT
ncbi:sigma-70 family RNA polymerase sigma factor [Nocardiopsis sediminis]|uniref:Sigma-70 family RNA polymerase sigma factor n=1 Tax=Nocardiopsis sediminis TaxID=1778267 RepID=A0ABV8FRU0_9ACTN